MGFLALLPILLQFLSVLPGLIMTAETAFSGKPGASGAAKKALVMSVVQAGTDAAVQAQAITPQQQSIITGVTSPAVDTIVGVINTVKGFPADWSASAGGPQEGATP